jgi:A/G-specific adenine glycosylase
VESIAPPLVAWYRAHRRDLPWRRTRDPYAIWVSEIMLQQTRVAAATPYWERWMARFPTVRALADAPLDDVLAAWAGLGYYSRARNLHRGARHVVDALGGTLPRTAAALVAIPGIGRYTAGAIASIAFGEATPLVDGNVLRLFARLRGIEDDVKGAAAQRAIWALAAAEVPADAPGDFNQGLMELGALICTPTPRPACDACPLAAGCAARAAGRQAALPVRGKPAPAAARPALRHVAAWIERRGKVLVARRPAAGLYGGLWELPHAPDRAALVAAFGGRLRLADAPRARHRQLLSHRRLEVELWPATLAGPAPATLPTHDRIRWHPRAELSTLAVSTATRAVIEQLEEPPCPRPSRRPTPKRSASSRPATPRSSRA